MTNLLLLGVAGALGSLSRYGVNLLSQSMFGDAFPWGTLIANIAGCFLFGLIWTLADHRLVIAPETRLIVLTGFMGAFTTFSTYIFESHALLSSSQWMLGVGNLLAQVVLGLLAFHGGCLLAMAGHSPAP